jgi:hypothetical protein
MRFCSPAIVSQVAAGSCYWSEKIISGEREKKVTIFIRTFCYGRKIYFFISGKDVFFLKVMTIKK